ncbi:hypothetical protein JVT61DRAFT_8922 [Boletus reticuloceps]|uniref:Phosphatidylinositol N-acetylglucosaminyltransferase subunit H conserved domain-containing protein n=1 Tax=Boletus reticuloceps TaxID=495285 RepID=A0A8I3A6E6_9AGAM|nr:hypothetical protein JVT61DRAFT_8922 [Boletus reticuloceps]
MRQTRPLPDTHPELTVLCWPGFTEYRVENWRLARDGSGRVVRGSCAWSWVDVGVVVLGIVWIQVEVPVLRRVLLAGIGFVFTCLVWIRFTQVLHESLLVFPTLGFQLETHRGHPFLPTLLITRHFIPLSALEDVVIHEGFRRWNVRFYLAALRRTMTYEVSTVASASTTTSTSTLGAAAATTSGTLGTASGRIEVRVAFENVLPYFPVLKSIYLGVQETLFPPPARVVQTGDDR